MKIKMIDLLNKISNGEEVPKHIKYLNLIWEYDDEIKDYINDDTYLIYSLNAFGLNNEIEIVEEPKKIEKLNLPSFEEFKTMNVAEQYVATAKEYDVLNELIDEINKLKEDDNNENNNK